MRKLTFSLLQVILSVLVLTGCENTPTPLGANGTSAEPDPVGLSKTRPGTGLVTVVHGVPGLTVDVYVNGQLTLPNFEPETVTDPLKLPEGDYAIAIVPEGGAFPDDTVIEGAAFLPAGANVSIVAHLTENADPTLSVFVNDTSPIRRKDSRLVVRHTAAAPTVDILLFDEDDDDLTSPFGKIEGLANPNEAQVEVRANEYFATINPAGNDVPVAGPVELTLPRRTFTAIYAVGSLSGGSFTLLSQPIRLRAADDDDDSDEDNGGDDDNDDRDDQDDDDEKDDRDDEDGGDDEERDARDEDDDDDDNDDRDDEDDDDDD